MYNDTFGFQLNQTKIGYVYTIIKWYRQIKSTSKTISGE